MGNKIYKEKYFPKGYKFLDYWEVIEDSPFIGGMGVVYITRDGSGNKYAIKTFQDKYLGDEDAINRFMQEAETWFDLERHSNIVFANGVFRVPKGYGKPYILLEYVDGGDLRGLIEDIDLPQALDLAIQFCSGMDYAYNKIEMIHRDIKPDNVMITKEGVAKITDFGLVTALKDTPIENDLTQKSAFISRGCGTWPYMPVEQFPEEYQKQFHFEIRPITTQSDIYSFGVMMYEVLTKYLPFATRNEIFTKNPDNPRKFSSEIPHELDTLVMKCLTKYPESRYRSFKEIQNELMDIYNDFTGRTYEIKGKEEKLTASDRLNRGKSYSELKRFPDAEREYEEVIRMEPTLAEEHLNFGALSYDSERFGEAKKEYRKEILTEAHNDLGALLYNLNRFKEAEKEYREAIWINPENVNAHSNLGALFRNLNRFGEAEKEYGEAIRINPENASAHYNFGVLFEELNRFKEAEKEYREAIRINPEFVAAYDKLGVLLRNLNRLKEAEELFRSAIRINPEYADAHYNLGVVLYDLKRFGEAEKENRKAIIIGDGDKNKLADAYGNLGTALYNLNRFGEAEKEYGEAIRINPEDAGAHYSHGVVLAKLNRFKEAEKEYREAIRLNPNYAEAHNNLGNLLNDLEREEEAEREYREAIRINPNFAEAHGGLGSLFWHNGRKSEAEEHFNKLLRLRPDLSGWIENVKRKY